MARFSSFALATVLSLGSTCEISQPQPAHAVEPISAAIVATMAVETALKVFENDRNMDAQKAIAAGNNKATIEAARLMANATSEMARAQIKAALIQAQNQVVLAVMNRKTQMDLEILRNKHNREQEMLRNEHNTEQKLIDTGLEPLRGFNKRYGQSIQPIFAPASNRSARTSNRPGVGGFQLFHY